MLQPVTIRVDPDFVLSALSWCGGHSQPRTHRFPPSVDGKPRPVGWGIVSALQSALKTTPIRIITQARVSEVTPGNRYNVTYIDKDAQKQTILADALVWTSGGYGHDWDGLLDEQIRIAPQLSAYRQFILHGKFENQNQLPENLRLSTTNGPFATGDGNGPSIYLD